MRRLKKENELAEIKDVFDENKLLEFAEKHCKRRELTKTTWNGRQIRIAFQTALALGYAGRKVRHLPPLLSPFLIKSAHSKRPG